MMEIVVHSTGTLAVVDYRIDGNPHRTREYDSWRGLFQEWGPCWSIDLRCTVWVRAAMQPNGGEE